MDRHRAAGLTLVEMLVGLAVGLVVVAAATAFVVAQANEVRALWIQSRVMHDLRIAAEVVARDLRRAGHWRDATATPWAAEGTEPARMNPHAALLPGSAPSDAARFSYSHDEGPDALETFGFRLHGGAIEMLLGDGHWQTLTDSTSVVVTAFTITPLVQQHALQGVCALPCTAAGCAPTQSVRSVNVAIHGRAAGDARIARSVQSLVRLRNDIVTGACPS